MSIWPILFSVSFLVNIVFAFYIRWLFLQIKQINDQVQDTANSVKLFSTHLKQLHEMEMFYGDTTLQGLLQHADELTSAIDEIDFIIYDEEPVEANDEEG